MGAYYRGGFFSPLLIGVQITSSTRLVIVQLFVYIVFHCILRLLITSYYYYTCVVAAVLPSFVVITSGRDSTRQSGRAGQCYI
jgi:hypothetical protein